MSQNKLDKESSFVIQNQHFSNENRKNLVQYVKYDAFPGLFFVHCNFESDVIGITSVNQTDICSPIDKPTNQNLTLTNSFESDVTNITRIDNS